MLHNTQFARGVFCALHNSPKFLTRPVFTTITIIIIIVIIIIIIIDTSTVVTTCRVARTLQCRYLLLGLTNALSPKCRPRPCACPPARDPESATKQSFGFS